VGTIDGVVRRAQRFNVGSRNESDHVGVHPCNRGGVGLVTSKAIANAEQHCDAGFSYAKACSGAVQFQPPPNENEHKRFNVDICSSQAIAIPRLSLLQGMSIGASHVNCFLRLVIGASECSSKKLAPHGRLNADELGARQPGLKQALFKGLKWTVLHWCIEERWPELPAIGQKFYNWRGTSEISEWEGLMTIAESATSAAKAGNTDPWKSACRAAIAARPFWSTWSTAMKDFAESVGVDQLKELSRILEVCQTSPPDAAMTYGRSGSQFYEAARKAKWNGLGQYPMCRMAMLTANSLCPFQEMEDGLARLIRASDFTKLTKKDSAPVIELAAQMMEGARTMSAQLPEPARLRLIG